MLSICSGVVCLSEVAMPHGSEAREAWGRTAAMPLWASVSFLDKKLEVPGRWHLGATPYAVEGPPGSGWPGLAIPTWSQGALKTVCLLESQFS